MLQCTCGSTCNKYGRVATTGPDATCQARQDLTRDARGVTVADKAVTALFTGVVRVRLSTTLALNH